MYSFIKEERLCNKKLTDELFHNGSSFLCYPFRVMWMAAAPKQGQPPAQLLIVVAKKRFKRAVDRNLLKRLTREAYRLNKFKYFYSSIEDPDRQLLISLSYIGKEINTFAFIQRKMQKLLIQLAAEVNLCGHL